MRMNQLLCDRVQKAFAIYGDVAVLPPSGRQISHMNIQENSNFSKEPYQIIFSRHLNYSESLVSFAVEPANGEIAKPMPIQGLDHKKFRIISLEDEQTSTLNLFSSFCFSGPVFQEVVVESYQWPNITVRGFVERAYTSSISKNESRAVLLAVMEPHPAVQQLVARTSDLEREAAAFRALIEMENRKRCSIL